MFDETGAIERLLAGDSEAVEKIVNQFEAPIYQYCLRYLGNQRSAEEAATEVFVRLFAQLGAETTEVTMREWIVRIAVNVCGDFQRHNRVRREKMDTLEERARNALQRLVRQQRTILLLNDLIRIDQKTIASILEMDEKMVCQRLARARSNFCEFLIQNGVELESAGTPHGRDRHIQQYRDLCSRYVDNNLDEEEKKQLLDHIQTCETCSAYLQDLTRVGKELARMGEEGMPENLKEDILAAVRIQMEKVQEKIRRQMHFPAFTLIAVAVVVVLLICSGSLGGLMVNPEDAYEKAVRSSAGSAQLIQQEGMEFEVGEIPESVLTNSYLFAIAAVGGEGLPELSTDAKVIATDEQGRTYYELDSDLASVEQLTEMLQNVKYETMPIYDDQIVIAGSAQYGLLVMVPEQSPEEEAAEEAEAEE
jgi:RNA polymerase sigma-70 factor (ECF subfamily)